MLHRALLLHHCYCDPCANAYRDFGLCVIESLQMIDFFEPNETSSATCNIRTDTCTVRFMEATPVHIKHIGRPNKKMRSFRSVAGVSSHGLSSLCLSVSVAVWVVGRMDAPPLHSLSPLPPLHPPTGNRPCVKRIAQRLQCVRSTSVLTYPPLPTPPVYSPRLS